MEGRRWITGMKTQIARIARSPFPPFRSSFRSTRKREWINSTLFVFERDRNLWRRGANTRRAASMGKMGGQR